MAKAPKLPTNLKERANAISSGNKAGWHKSAGKPPENVKGPAFLSGPGLDALGRSYRRWKTNKDDPHGQRTHTDKDEHGNDKGGGTDKKKSVEVTPQNASQVLSGLAKTVTGLTQQVGKLQDKIHDLSKSALVPTSREMKQQVLQSQYSKQLSEYNGKSTKEAIPAKRNMCQPTLHESELVEAEEFSACGAKHSGVGLDSPIVTFKGFKNQFHVSLANGREGIFTPDTDNNLAKEKVLAHVVGAVAGTHTPEARFGEYGLSEHQGVPNKLKGLMEARVPDAVPYPQSRDLKSLKPLIGEDAYNNVALHDMLTGETRTQQDILLQKNQDGYKAVLTNNGHPGFTADGRTPFAEDNHSKFDSHHMDRLNNLTDEVLHKAGKALHLPDRHVKEIQRRRDIIKHGIEQGYDIHDIHKDIQGTLVKSVNGEWKHDGKSAVTHTVTNGDRSIEFDSKKDFTDFVHEYGHDYLTHMHDVLDSVPGHTQKTVGRNLDYYNFTAVSPSVHVEGQLSRMDKSEFNLDYVHVNEKAQGKGLLQQFFKGAVPELEKMGRTSLKLRANVDVGGYAWAKYGFDFASPTERKQYLKEFKKFCTDRKVNAPEGMHHSWDIASVEAPSYHGKHGSEIGKEFMLHKGNSQGWFGELDLSDKKGPGRQQFEAYVTDRKIKK